MEVSTELLCPSWKEGVCSITFFARDVASSMHLAATPLPTRMQRIGKVLSFVTFVASKSVACKCGIACSRSPSCALSNVAHVVWDNENLTRPNVMRQESGWSAHGDKDAASKLCLLGVELATTPTGVEALDTGE
jgi:hypothetical protein